MIIRFEAGLNQNQRMAATCDPVRLGALRNSLSSPSAGSFLSFWYCRPVWSLRRQKCRLWQFRQFCGLHGQSQLLHAGMGDSLSRVGRDGCRVVIRSRTGSWHLASLGGSWKFSSPSIICHSHGHLFRDQVSAGLFGIFGVGGGALARVIPHPHAEGDIVNPFC